MNKFINWTFGSFFRTLGRFLFYLFIGFLISMIISKSNIKLPSFFDVLQVDALQVGGVEYSMPSDVKLYNNLSQTSSSLVNTYSVLGNTWDLDTGVVEYYGEVSTTTSGYGASWCVSAPTTFMIDYIYNVQIVVANERQRDFNVVSNGNYDLLRIGYSTSDASSHRNTTSIAFFGAIYDSRGIYINGSPAPQSQVYVLTYLFTSKLNGQFICLPFKHNANSSNEMEYFFGMKVDILGKSDILTNAQLNTAISNSGLATASSISQVQSSINQVQQEIAGTQSAIEEQTEQQQENHEETINTITDDAPPDNLSALSNSAGWLPAGAVDSILNLPLNFLNSLFNNLSKTCTPVVLPLPFVNQNLQLPCVNSLYSQINGVPNWINGTVGLIASAFILFSYLIRLYKYIDDTLTFRENNYIDNWSGV